MTFSFHVIYKMHLLTRVVFRPYLKIISKGSHHYERGTQMPWFSVLTGPSFILIGPMPLSPFRPTAESFDVRDGKLR